MEALHNHKKIKEKENKTKPREMKTQAKNTHNSQIKTRKTKIKCKSQIAFNDIQHEFSYDDIIKLKIMYHMYIMSWHA